MILILSTAATREQIAEMRDAWDAFVKVAIDVDRGILAGGGHLHSDCESELLAAGCRQESIWAATWFAETGTILFDSIVNIRPSYGNRSRGIDDDALRARVTEIINRILGGVV